MIEGTTSISLKFLYLLLALLGFVLLYLIKRRVFSLRQWGIALLASLTWGLGGLLGWHLTSRYWLTVFMTFEHGRGFYFSKYVIPALPLSGVLAALLGCTTLYLLLRYLPEKHPPSSDRKPTHTLKRHQPAP